MSWSNYLKMMKRQQVLALLDSAGRTGTSSRRPASAGKRSRGTIARAGQMRPKCSPALRAPRSCPRQEIRPQRFKPGQSVPRLAFKCGQNVPRLGPSARASAAVYRDVIVTKLDVGLSLQRIWQDLVEEFGYGTATSRSNDTSAARPTEARGGGVHSEPGEEGQIDFFRGAPTFESATGQWARPWVFRLTLCHSRHGYEEAAWDQKIETFLRLHESAFQDIGGVPRVLRHDNLKAAVVRACLYDPDSNDIYTAFANTGASPRCRSSR